MSRVVSKKRINWNANWDVSQDINEMAKLLVREIKFGLNTKTDVNDRKFKRLKLATVKSKKRKGYAQPSTPLIATGRMREIYFKKKSTKTNLRAIISPAQDRVIIGYLHNIGEGVLPQRKWFGISENAHKRMQRVWKLRLVELLRLRRCS